MIEEKFALHVPGEKRAPGITYCTGAVYRRVLVLGLVVVGDMGRRYVCNDCLERKPREGKPLGFSGARQCLDCGLVFWGSGEGSLV